MKWKYIFLACFLVCLYGFLPVSISWNKNDYSKPNQLLIHHQECGCPCPQASIKKGELLIPEEIKRKYPGLYLKEINLAGLDSFEPFESGLSQNDINIDGRVIGVDTIACSASGCEVVPVFEISFWSVNSYYPRFWIHSKWFVIIFLLSFLVTIFSSVILIFDFFWKKLKGTKKPPVK